jgi:DNA-binding winged helix-turn-helix (wHTH) protein
MTTAYVFAPYRLLPQQRQLLSAGEPVKLGGRAFDVLLALVERRDRTVGKHELMDLVWPHLVVEENNLQVQMVALRKLLGHAAIATVPGRGYRFTLPVVAEGEPAPVAAPAPATAEIRPPRRGNLPLKAPALIGRDDDLRAVLGMLERHALVTLAGAGGIGKTRLAQAAAVAAAQADAWPDGVWWVDLSSLADGTRVDETVAQALSFGAQAGTDAVSALWAALPAQASLLVLDNAEHVLEGVARFASRVRDEAPPRRCCAWAANRCTAPSRWPCPMVTIRSPWHPARPWRCSWRARRRPAGTSCSTRATARRWPTSAGAWTAFRWRSSWRRHGRR